jgi:DNA processing protein
MIRLAKTPGASPLPPDDQRALIALSLVPGVGTSRIRSLVSVFGSPRGVLGASRSALTRVPGVGPRTAGAIAAFRDDAAVDRQIAEAERVGTYMVTLWDGRYPHLLRQIYDPPAFLWVRGELPAAEGPGRAIGIVGTRRPTSYGRRTAYDFAYVLARLGFTIVSGLAYGIDAVAHGAALEAGGRTLAVLGSGMDKIYPSRHGTLAREIANGGALLSEFPLGTKPEGSNFPRRNRLVSGLCLGTVIIEAYEEGGALITARLALEQNREVFAVPGPIHSPSSAGTNRLIQHGEARLVLHVEDVLQELGIEETTAGTRMPAVDPSDLAPGERRLCRALATDPMHIDAICSAADVDPATALVDLLNLEFKGIVRQLAGKHFCLAAAVVT